MLRRVRRPLQGLSLGLFFLLLVLTRYQGQDEIAYPVRLFLDLDPFILAGALLSSGAATVALYWALGVLALSLVFGRAFCSWVCPLGALNQLVGRWRKRSGARTRAVHRYSPVQSVKYGVLAGTLLAALLGLQWTGLVDPISLAIRSFSLALGPAAELGLRGLFDALYRTEIGAVQTVSEPVYGLAKQSVLSFEQPAFRQAELIGAIALLVLALNLLRPRFFCRFVCPLGAMLGLVGRASLLRLRVSGECNNCGLCQTRCPGGADPQLAAEGKWRPAECLVCGNCTAVCDRGLGFRFELPRVSKEKRLSPKDPHPQPLSQGERGATTTPSPPAPLPEGEGSTTVAGIDAGRRNLLWGAAAGLAAVPLVKLPLVKKLPSPLLIRPPGSLAEDAFLDRCVRCGECMKVCLTGGLQPAGLEAGLEGLWTPVLVPRMGYCEYNCTLCGQVCPTGAIKELAPENKRRVRIGTATVDPALCLPLRLGVECIVCEEHCPTSPKAIVFAEVEAIGADGNKRRVRRPVVDPERCIGCGICEARCPVRDIPAIRVTSAGESRQQQDQLLLEPRDAYGKNAKELGVSSAGPRGRLG